jgi:hypothetical protein
VLPDARSVWAANPITRAFAAVVERLGWQAAAVIIDAVLLTAVLQADLGTNRKIDRLRILRPLLIAAAIVPLYLKAVATTGNGLTLEIAAGVGGIVLGLLATGLMSVYRSPATDGPVTRTGFAYAALWTIAIGARAAFSYGSEHWFSHSLDTWMIQHSVTAAAITDGLIFMAVAMLLTRTIGMAVRAANLQPATPAPQMHRA